jgi:phage-related protein
LDQIHGGIKDASSVLLNMICFILKTAKRFIWSLVTGLVRIFKFPRNALKTIVLHVFYGIRTIANLILKLAKFIFRIPLSMISAIHQLMKFVGREFLAYFSEIRNHLTSFIKTIHMDIYSLIKNVAAEILTTIHSIPRIVIAGLSNFFRSFIKNIFNEIFGVIKRIGSAFRFKLETILKFIFNLPFLIINFFLRLPDRIKNLYNLATFFLRFGASILSNLVSSYYRMLLFLSQLTFLLQTLASFPETTYKMLLKFE